MHVRASTSTSLLRAAVAERVKIPATDDGVATTTTTSCLRATMAERVMATVAGSGVAVGVKTGGSQVGGPELCV